MQDEKSPAETTINCDPSLALSMAVMRAGELALYEVLGQPFIPTSIVKQVFWAMRRAQIEEERAMHGR